MNPVQLLFLIASPQLADRATEIFQKENLPLQYRFHAEGTASSDIADMLGLGSADKAMLISVVAKECADGVMRKLRSQLRLGTINSGVAFTVPISGVSKLIMHMMNLNADLVKNSGKENVMTNQKYALIVAVVGSGYSQDVMTAAKAAGAGGGTLLHSHGIGSHEITETWGLGDQEERDFVLILAPADKKVNIMSAITAKCGINSPARGIVMSLPVDSAFGLREDE